MPYQSHHRFPRSMPVSMPHMVYLSKHHSVRPRLCASTSVTPPLPHVSTTQVGTLPAREVQVPPKREPTILLVQILQQELVLFLNLGPWLLPMVKFGQAKPVGLGRIDTADSDHQYRLSVLQWNPGPARRNPTNIIAAACGRFHAVLLQAASDDLPHISDHFIAYTGNTDLAILLNKDTLSLTLWCLLQGKLHKQRYLGYDLLIVRGPPRRPSLSGTPTVTFCSVHPQCRGQET